MPRLLVGVFLFCMGDEIWNRKKIALAIDENIVSAGSDSKYEKIGDYKVKDYVERPHEYQK